MAFFCGGRSFSFPQAQRCGVDGATRRLKGVKIRQDFSPGLEELPNKLRQINARPEKDRFDNG
jgi:hypothetical protein